MNSSFYESITKITKTKLNNANLNNSGQVYLNSPKLNFNLPANDTNLQPLNVSYETNANVRLLRSSSLKESRLGTFIKNKLTSSEGLGASIWAKEVEYLDMPNVINNKNYNVVSSALFEDNSRFFKRKEGVHNPISVRPIYLSDDSIYEVKNTNLNLLNTRYETGINEIAPKPKPHNNFMVMKQKRYKRRKNIKETKYTLGTKALEYYKTHTNIKATAANKGKILLSRDNSLSYTQNEQTRNYKFFMKNKVRGDDTNIAVSRRMIRTKRTLVLPAHVNLTAITNSYDVIHSWFIPGLGLKMDCIPGRSTHHTFYIDNVGFYYGQCAEVCGRYHHHMPIRICALPFDHFLLWWHHFGVPKLLPNNTSKRVDITSGLRKYVW